MDVNLMRVTVDKGAAEQARAGKLPSVMIRNLDKTGVKRAWRTEQGEKQGHWADQSVLGESMIELTPLSLREVAEGAELSAAFAAGVLFWSQALAKYPDPPAQIASLRLVIGLEAESTPENKNRVWVGALVRVKE